MMASLKLCSFIQQTFFEQLLCASHGSLFLRHSSKQDRPDLYSQILYFSEGRLKRMGKQIPMLGNFGPIKVLKQQQQKQGVTKRQRQLGWVGR